MKIKRNDKRTMCRLNGIKTGECFEDAEGNVYMLLPKLCLSDASEEYTNPERRLVYDLSDDAMVLLRTDTKVYPVDSLLTIGKVDDN